MGTRARPSSPSRSRTAAGAAAAVARGVEEAALALGHRAACSTARRTSSPAASCSASRSAPRWRAARGCCCSTSRPPSSTRSRATSCSACCGALNEEWGTAVVLAEHRLERCLPAADRVIALRGRPRRVRRRRPRRSWLAPRRAADAGRAAVRARRPRPAPGDGQGGAPRTRPRLLPPSRRTPTPAAASLARGARGATRRSRSSASGSRCATGPRSCAASTLDVARGRGGRADGPQRRGQVDAAEAAAGLIEPTRGRIERAGRVALLLQNPGDYLLARARRRRVPAPTLEAAGLGQLADAPPARPLRRRAPAARARDRARAASAPAVVCLDEPTRGMDRAHKDRARRAAARARRGGAGGASSPRTTPSSRPRSPTAPCCSATARRSPTRRPPRCSPAAGTSPPRPRACSAAPAER